ncbi:unnamed protein product [Rotaria magnacalcarata]|uniref:BEN domain-containing protein n=2 Tax=Rotaria magnacalcarata TaxID=392030 RepID=A0A815EVR6_9BILA|nr:unnamed protein product [Rotaria magnacalcarata]
MRAKRRTVNKTKVVDYKENESNGDSVAKNSEAHVVDKASLSIRNSCASTLLNEKENQLVTSIEAVEEEKQPTEGRSNNCSSSSGSSDEDQDIVPLLLKEYESCKGQKRPFQDSVDSNEREKLLDSSMEILGKDVINLKKQCVNLEARLKKLEGEWMPRPQHPEVINYFMNTANILRGVEKNNNDNTNESMEKIIQSLGLDKNLSSKYNKKTATSTARNLMKFLFPNPEPDFTIKNVDQSIIDKIINYTSYSNPNDQSSDAEIRTAIRNYFASLNHHNKGKTNAVSKNIDQTSNTNNDQNIIN